MPPVPTPADPPGEVEVVDNREALKVLGWRMEYLVRGGYDAEAAQLIAESSADIHRATELLERGCSTNTALLILL